MPAAETVTPVLGREYTFVLAAPKVIETGASEFTVEGKHFVLNLLRKLILGRLHAVVTLPAVYDGVVAGAATGIAHTEIGHTVCTVPMFSTSERIGAVHL